MLETWSIKDLVIIVALIFNFGGLVGIIRHHQKTVDRDLADLFARMRKVEVISAKNEGRLNGAK